MSSDISEQSSSLKTRISTISLPIPILSPEDLTNRHYTHDITQKSFTSPPKFTPLTPSKSGFLSFLKHSLTPSSHTIPASPLNSTISSTSTSTSTSTPSSLNKLSLSPTSAKSIKKKNKDNYHNKLFFPDSYNLYSGNLYAIPNNIFSLRNIVKLNVANNQITRIPSEISQLTLLEELYVDRNLLEVLPLEIIQLSKITIFAISNNPIKYDLLHPLIIRYLRMINWGKKLVVQELEEQKLNPSSNEKIQIKKIFLLERRLETINFILDKKTKRSIKTMILHNKIPYLDVINHTKECLDIQPACRTNIENFITKFGSELYCVIRNCTKIVSYYDYFEKCDVIKTIRLDKNSVPGQIITFCSVLEYFYNFANASVHRLTLYQMFNSAFGIFSKIDSLNELMFTLVNILNGFDPYVNLTINLSKN